MADDRRARESVRREHSGYCLTGDPEAAVILDVLEDI